MSNPSQRLKELLKTRGLDISTVSRDSGISDQDLVEILEGKKKIDAEMLNILFRKYGFNPIYIISGKGPGILEAKYLDDLLAVFEGAYRDILEEDLKREYYSRLVSVLEKVHEPWRLVPKAAVETFARELEEEYFREENLSYKRFKGSPFQFLALRLRGKIPYYLYLGLMKFSLRRFFIFKKKYWLKCVQAIWRLYWALCLDRIPFHSDLAIVSMIYVNTDDATVAVQKFKKKIRKKRMEKNWREPS